MTETNHKLRALFLAALMVLSVFAMTMAFTGSSVARTGNVDDGGEDHDIEPGDTVFQQEDVNTVNAPFDTNPILTGVAGAAEGQTLDLSAPIPEDQTTGTYTTDGDSSSPGVTVVQPRITDSEINTASGGDVTGSTIGPDTAEDLRVTADYNFEDAEQLEVTVEDSNGVDITNEVLTNHGDADNLIEGDSAGEQNSPDAVGIDLSDQDAGEYSIILEGAGDIGSGDATVTMTVSVTTEEGVGVDLDDESVTQGTNAGFTITNGVDGDLHVVTVASADFRDDISTDDAKRIFRNVGDTTEVGIADGSATNASGSNSGPQVDGASVAYAIVEIDGSSGVGSINTQFLDTTSVEVEVFAAGTGVTTAVTANEEDDETLDVTEGDISISSPSGSYVVGSQVTINGTATSSNDVAVYARDGSNWEVVELDGSNTRTINVDSDDAFEDEDVVLSAANAGGNDILSLEGNYRFGVIDAVDADVDNDGTPDEVLDTSDFNSGTSASTALRVTSQDLAGEFSTINGQVAPPDDAETDVTGAANGAENVLVVFVDERGNVGSETISVDNDGTFDEEDLNVVDQAGSALREGQVSAHIISLGRDGTSGDGDVPNQPGGTLTDLQTWINSLDNSGLSGEQVNSNIEAETVDDTASDDLIVTQTFRLADSSTSIDSVYPSVAQADGINPVATGETMVIAGSTNLRPDDNTITVEITDGSGTSLALEDTDDWGTDGQWSLEVDTSDLDPGTYTVEADDGDNTDVAEIEIVSERQTEEPPETETEPPETETEPPETETEPPETETEPMTDEPAETTESDGQPGFGIAIALVALIAAALLAVRRRD